MPPATAKRKGGVMDLATCEFQTVERSTPNGPFPRARLTFVIGSAWCAHDGSVGLPHDESIRLFAFMVAMFYR